MPESQGDIVSAEEQKFARRHRILNATMATQNRVQIAGLAAAISTEADPVNKAVLKELDRPLTLTFSQPTPLKKVLESVKTSLAGHDGKPIPIYVDPIAMERSGARLEWPVTIDLEGVPLRTSLRLVLKQCGLAYCVRDGVLIISSVEGIREELAEEASEAMGKDPQQRQQVMDMATQGMGMGGMGGGMR